MNRMLVIAGPCVIESEDNVMMIAESIKNITERLNLECYFKASFDKANRTSISSYRGPGIEKGIQILKTVKDKYNLKICTDIHEPWQAEMVAQVADIIQIPAFLCRQTDLLIAAAKTGKIINVKKAQFLAPWDMKHVIKKIEDSGNHQIMLCERGSVFGYNRLVVDMTCITEMKKLGYPVVFDATHSVQRPGGGGDITSGTREYIEPLAKAAVAAGADALFFEVHPDPNNALSDGSNMVKLDEFEDLLKRVCRIYYSLFKEQTNILNNHSINDEAPLYLENVVQKASASCSSKEHTISLVKQNIEIQEKARHVFDLEIDALKIMRNNLDDTFQHILDFIIKCTGKVVITGMGKSGHIGTKIAATLASLGTPSFFLHPAEAMHGDLGMLSKEDVIIAISYSGESDEIIKIIPNIKMIGAVLIAITGNRNSTLAKTADIVQVLPNFEEACSLGLAPTSSTTVELVYGDALAVVASYIYGFKETDFGKRHPAGSLGKKLVLTVEDLMVKGQQNPVIDSCASMKDAIIIISRFELGMVSVIDKNRNIIGIITDGDLRRILERGENIYSLKVSDVMTCNPIVIESARLAIDALKIMKDKNINCLPVISNRRIVGGIKMQKILEAGIIDMALQ